MLHRISLGRNKLSQLMSAYRALWLIAVAGILLLPAYCFAGLVDNGNGTITDTQTGLTWLSASQGTATFGSALDQCEGGTWAGHDDWRLPDRNELQSIVEYGAYNPAVNASAFPGTVSGNYWSSSLRMAAPSQAWYVSFSNGVVSYADTGTSYYFRPVRGGSRALISVQDCAARTPYVDNGDGTVYDRETGLTWLKNDLGTMNLTRAFDVCENGTWAGHDDWRLPNRNELQSLVYYKHYNPSADARMFPGIVSGNYWSSSIRMASPSQGWYVSFSNGVVSYADAASSYYVRPVRGGTWNLISDDACQARTPYYDAGDEAVADADTGLMWVENSIGPVTWEQALALCENGNWGGHNDWRLPDRNELQSLVYYKQYNPAIDPQKFKDTWSGNYWSSTTRAADPTQSWYVSFSNGVVSYAGKTSRYYVRPVRDNPGSITVSYGDGRGYALAGELFTLKFVSEESIAIYYWDIDNDGRYYHLTFDNELHYAFDSAGTYTIRVKAVTTDGRKIYSLVTVRVGAAGNVDSDIRFEAFELEGSSMVSRVMKGGRAVRHYRVRDAGTGAALAGKRICYQFNGTGVYYCQDTDDQGFLEIKTPAVETSGVFTLQVVGEDGSPASYQVWDAPSFFVSVQEREFTEAYGLFVGYGASVGKGAPGFKLGPVEFRTARGGVGVSTHVIAEFGYENKGSDADLFVDSSLGAELEFKIYGGLFGKMFKTKTLPEVEIGASLELYAGSEVSTGYDYDDFLDNGSVDEVQALAAGIILLESVMNARPQIVVGMDRLLFSLINKTYEIYGLDMTADILGNAFTFGGDVNVGASLRLKNPLGLTDTAGSSLEVDFSGFDGEYAYTYASEFDFDGGMAFSQCVAVSMEIGSLNFAIGQKFSGDKRRNDTPKFSLGSILSTSPLLQRQGEWQAAIQVLPDGSKSLEYSRLLKRAEENFMVFGADTTEKYIHYSITDPKVISSLAGESELAWEMSSLGNGEFSGISVSPWVYTELNDVLMDNEVGSVAWQERTREQQLFDLSLDFELSLGLSLGFGGTINAWKQIEYVTAQGAMREGAQYILAQYEKDGHIENAVHGIDPFINAGLAAVRNVCSEVTDTILAITEAGKDAIVEIMDTGAKIGAVAGDFVEGSMLFLTKITPLQKSYAIKALDSVSAKGVEEANADTVGEVYIVNVHDENGESLNEFPAALQLTLTYTEADLIAAGYTLDDAVKLRIYRWDTGAGYYILAGGSVNTVAQSVTVAILKPGQYLLAIDDAPPEVGLFDVSAGTLTPEISFVLRDSLSGIDLSTVEMRIDGELLVDAKTISEIYDVGTGVFTYQVVEELTLGSHTLEITATDRMGNVLTRSETFDINNLPPVIVHTAVTSAVIGEPLFCRAQVTDDQGMNGVLLGFRAKTDELPYELVSMTLNDGDGTYQAEIPGKYLTGHGIRYFIRAVDISGNISETDPVDIVIADLTGPEIPGVLSIAFSDERFRVSWPLSPAVDTAGYRLYRGESPENLALMEDLGLTGFEYLETDWDDYFVGVAAVDDFNNEGAMVGPLLTGRKADADRDRDVDGSDMAELARKLAEGNADMTLEYGASVLGECF